MTTTVALVAVPVGKRVLAWWVGDPPEENRRFLRRLDPTFFETLYDQLGDIRNDRVGLLVQTHLRMLKDQAAEMLFALVLASIQAPIAPAMWLTKYNNSELQEMLEALVDGRQFLTQRGKIDHNWESVVDMYFQDLLLDDESQRLNQRAAIVKFLQVLSGEYLKPTNLAEYNCSKHGLRISPGHWVVSAGGKQQDGVKLEGSGYGTSFLIADRLVEGEQHYQLIDHYRCWNPEAIHFQIQVMVALSKNIITWLRQFNGDKNATSWLVPDDPAVFDRCWEVRGDYEEFSYVRPDFRGAEIHLANREELISMCHEKKPVILFYGFFG